jgi:uncharacterized protein (UPF0335 family)
MSEQEYKDLIARIELMEDELDRIMQKISILMDTLNKMQ